MRKHFLILMLLTLLPFTAWAADFATEAKVTVDDIYFGLNVAKVDEVKYVTVKINTNTLNEDATGGFTLDKTGGKVNYYTTEACTTKAELIGLTPVPGTYYVKVLPYDSSNSNWAAGKVIVKSMPIKVAVADAEKVFNKKGTEDNAEVLGAITSITLSTKTGWDTPMTEGATFNALKAQMTVSREAGMDVNDYKYDVDFAAENDNYTIGSVTGTFSINPAPFPTTPGITPGTTSFNAVVSDYEKVYNGANQHATLTITDNKLGYTLTAKDFDVFYNGEAAAKNVGNYTISFKTKGNYTEQTIILNAEGDKELTIAKQPLKIYVNEVSKVYDGTTDIPATTFGYSGLVGSDLGKAAPFGDIYGVAYVTESADNKYVNQSGYQLMPVKIAEAAPETNFNNYEIELRKTGLLMVTPRPLKITADNKSKTFGASDPAFTFTVQALDAVKKEGVIAADLTNINAAYKVVRTSDVETVGAQTGVLMPTKKADSEIPAGSRAAVLKTVAQYTITPVVGNFTITGATLTVYPKAQFITYGDEYDLANVEIIAVNNGGKKVTLTSTNAVKFKEENQHPTDAGIYTLVVDGDVTADGYSVIEKLESQFTISPKALTVTPKEQTLHVGNKKDALALYNEGDSKVELVGLINGDKIKYELDFNTTSNYNEYPDKIPTQGWADHFTEEQVNEYNATLEGAISTETVLTAEQAATLNAIDGVATTYVAGRTACAADVARYNAQFTIVGSDVLTADEVEAYNEAKDLGDPEIVAGQALTAEKAEAYNATLEGLITTETELNPEQVATINALVGVSKEYAEGESATDADVALYNAAKGAKFYGLALTEVQANLYNATLEGAISPEAVLTDEQAETLNGLDGRERKDYEAGDNPSAADAAAYNATLDGAKEVDGTLTADEAETYNGGLGLITTETLLSAEQVTFINALEGVSQQYTVDEVPAEADVELYNAAKGELKAGVALTAEQAVAYNATLENAISTETELEGQVLTALNDLPNVGNYVEGEYPTANDAILYNATVGGALAADGYATKDQAAAYNANAAITALLIDETTVLNEDQVGILNVIDGIAPDYIEGQKAVEADVNAYNLTLDGAKSVGDEVDPVEQGIDENGVLLVADIYNKGIKIISDFDPENAEDMANYDNNNYVIDWTGTAKLIVVAAKTLVLDDTDPDLDAKIAAAHGTEGVTFTFSSRTLKAGQWNTLVLPFETTVPELSQKLGYAVVDVLDENNTNEASISLVLAFGTLPANKPFLVQPAADKNLNEVQFSGKIAQYSDNPVAEDAANHSFIGVYTMGKKVTSADKTEYYYNVTRKQFVNGGSAGTAINPMRAYLKDNSTVGVREFSIQEPNGQTTVITNVNTEAEFNTNEVYDIRGMKMQGVPTEKGVYIINGKKVVIK